MAAWPYPSICPALIKHTHSLSMHLTMFTILIHGDSHKIVAITERGNVTAVL